MGQRLHSGASGVSLGAGTPWCHVPSVWGQARTSRPQPLGYPGGQSSKEKSIYYRRAWDTLFSGDANVTLGSLGRDGEERGECWGGGGVQTALGT